MGDDRYSEYLRLQSPDYRSLMKFAEQNDISREIANRIHETRLSSETLAAGIRFNSSLSDHDRDQRLRELRLNTEETLKKLAGQAATESLLHSPQGSWLRLLDKTPASTSSKQLRMILPAK